MPHAARDASRAADRPGALRGRLEALLAGSLFIEHLHPADLARIAELVAIYRDLPLGTVDAAVIAAAERLEATTIATLDRRHFGVVRPAHVGAFELVP